MRSIVLFFTEHMFNHENMKLEQYIKIVLFKTIFIYYGILHLNSNFTKGGAYIGYY